MMRSECEVNFFFIKLDKAFTNSTNLGSAHAKMPL